MTKHIVRVTQWVEVEIDESKFDDEFMKEFTAHFFNYDTITEHVEHLAQLYARGIADDNEFIEGYGPPRGMGIRFRDHDFEVEREPSLT